MTKHALTRIERLQKQHEKENFLLREKKERITALFGKIIIRINQEVDLPQFKASYFPDEDRTLEFVIDGMEDLDTGIVFEKGKVRTIRKIDDTPTVRFSCDEDTFLLIATGELSFVKAHLLNWLKIEGENWVRDVEIFKRLFNKYGHILRGG